MYRTLIFLFLLSIVCQACSEKPSEDQTEKNQTEMENSAPATFVFVGTYTRNEGHVDGKAEGIYVLEMDRESGELRPVSSNGGVINPSYLTLAPNKKYAYAVNEIGSAVDTAGSITAFAIDPDSLTLTPLNKQSSRGFAPCYVSTDSQGRFVFGVNYSSGVVVMLPVREDGTLGPAREIIQLEGKGLHDRQGSPHPHSIVLSPDEKYAYVPDLGTDRIMIFEIDYPEGLLHPAPVPYVEVAPASGPRHFVFHPNGRYAYVINELSNTINAFSYQADSGKLTPIQSVFTLPEDFSEQSYTADIHLTPDGKFLYGSNRGHDSIVIYSVDAASGKLTLVGHESTQGKFPRNFAIYGGFLYVANQNSNNIVGFRIDPATGKLTKVSEAQVPTPVCLQFMDM